MHTVIDGAFHVVWHTPQTPIQATHRTMNSGETLPAGQAAYNCVQPEAAEQQHSVVLGEQQQQ
jgi:hypothetical protein